ncbi:hypothetical protein NSPZN2_10312 [Nitrospira defluvii]|uniref:Uncharacterized protein n=1 Tax=Nitrospira defluvii TaxID=330214 RepID=A0ABM8QEG3_9BACT|nr:hypothetical protein NSPZN2_10312 [Nitrospira defluvii]
MMVTRMGLIGSRLHSASTFV